MKTIKSRENHQDLHQTTIKNPVILRSPGLHSGKQIQCTIRPAEANHGIVFIRSDLRNLPKVEAEVNRVVRTDMCTILGDQQGNIIATVEHLMAAIVGLGIDNAIIEVDGPEVPIMDGSALEYAMAIQDSGVIKLDANKKVFRLKKSVGVRHLDKWVFATPANKLSISGTIEFKHRVIGSQKYDFTNQSHFMKDLAAARTFGFLKEVEYLHKRGLALGGSLDNAIVLDDEKILNTGGLRYKNEFVRHKVLDALGDLALAGRNLHAAVQLHKSGHELHAAFLKKIFSDPNNYEIVDLTEVSYLPEEAPRLQGLKMVAVS